MANTKYRKLLKAYQRGANIVIRDYDTYDAVKAYKDEKRHPYLLALENPHMKFGHGFCIAMALTLDHLPRWHEQWVL